MSWSKSVDRMILEVIFPFQNRRIMRKKDILTTDYISVKERFADALNVGVFHGKRVISPEQIREIDTASKIILQNREQTKQDGKQAYRDVLKTVVYDTNFCIIGIENQSEIHYVFPVRSMMYDAMSYKKQWNQIQREHRKRKDLHSAEFLSGFSKEDFLHPVVTLVVYYGTEPWDGAKDIHSLINWENVPEEFKEIVPNYSIYLLELNQYENLEDFQTDLKTVCRFLQNSDGAGKIKKMLKEHRGEFEDMAEDTYNLIRVLGNIKEVEMVKNLEKTERGGVNMCKGLEEWREELLVEGMEQGIKVLLETYREFGITKRDALSKVENKFALDKNTAEKYLEKYWGDVSEEI